MSKIYPTGNIYFKSSFKAFFVLELKIIGVYILTEYSAWLLPSAGLLITSTVAAFIEC